MKTILFTLALILALYSSALAGPAQDVEFRLDVNRDFGYGNGADVRGNFSLTIYGEQAKIQAVTYRMDGNDLARLDEPPFRFRFSTNDYPVGQHELSAVVETTDGREVTTPPIRLNFVSAETESEAMKRIFGGLFAILAVLVVIGGAVTALSARGGAVSASRRIPPGTPRNYGLMGGTICPRCNRPYPVHIWSLSLLVGRLDRCENCGKWALVRRYPLDVLRAAEQAELEAAQADAAASAGTPQTDEERLRKLLEESRYMNDK